MCVWGGGGGEEGGSWECGLRVEQGQDGQMKCCFRGGSRNALPIPSILAPDLNNLPVSFFWNEKICSSNSSEKWKERKKEKTEVREELYSSTGTLTLSRRKLRKKRRKKKAVDASQPEIWQ